MATRLSAEDPDQVSAQNEPSVDFNDVFSLRRPKDARAGLSSGLKSMAKVGPVLGCASLLPNEISWTNIEEEP